tara:strand:+ start:76 stop:1281 length:1206 start_codon:yes stop_codon:yes gene_type:complete
MVKTIYLVAGKRLIKGVAHFGGLYANVGETERSVIERLKDEDYRRKNSGGDWEVLKTWGVESFVSDSDLHKILKSSKYADRIIWEKSSNTEEFYFIGDDGKGSVAIPIIQKELEELSVWQAYPAVVEENKCLTQENKILVASKKCIEDKYESLIEKIKDSADLDWMDESIRLQGDLEKERREKAAAADELSALYGLLLERQDNLRRVKGACVEREEEIRAISSREKKELLSQHKKSLSDLDVGVTIYKYSLFILFLLSLICFGRYYSNNTAAEELEALAIASEQQVEKLNLRLANAEKENKTNLDKIAKLEEEAKKKVAKKKAKPKKATSEELTQCKFFTNEGKNLICSSNGKYYKIHGSSFLDWGSGTYTGKTVKILKIGGERWYTIRNEQHKLIKIENL